MKKKSNFRALEPDLIVATLTSLQQRIAERFLDSGLTQVSRELTRIALESAKRTKEIARPNIALRCLFVLVVVLMAVAAAYLVVRVAMMLASATQEDAVLFQGLDAGVSLLIVFGGAAYFLFSLEGRLKRGKALAALHELRSIVHVIDMHQLTKDPSAYGAPRTSSSPDRPMSLFLLQRYLNYCSELLSLASKVAALYVQKDRDPVVIDAVGDIERLTTNLSTKIWQKINAVQDRTPGRPPSSDLGPYDVP